MLVNSKKAESNDMPHNAAYQLGLQLCSISSQMICCSIVDPDDVSHNATLGLHGYPTSPVKGPEINLLT